MDKLDVIDHVELFQEHRTDQPVKIASSNEAVPFFVSRHQFLSLRAMLPGIPGPFKIVPSLLFYHHLDKVAACCSLATLEAPTPPSLLSRKRTAALCFVTKKDSQHRAC